MKRNNLLVSFDSAFLILSLPFVFLIHFLLMSSEGFLKDALALILGAVIFGLGFLRPALSVILFSLLVVNQRLIVIPTTDISILNVFVIPIIYFIFRRKGVVVKKSMSAMLTLGLSLGLLSSVSVVDFSRLVTMIKALVILFTLMLFLKEQSPRVVLLFAKSFAAGCAIAALAGFAVYGVDFESRFNLGDDNNPNISAISCLLAFSILLVLRYHKKVDVVFFYGVSLPLILFGIATKSKTFFIGLVVVFIMYVFFSSGSVKRILLLAGGVFFSIFAAHHFIETVASTSFSRLVVLKNGDYSSGRLDIWLVYMDFFSNNLKSLLLGGVGVDRYFDGQVMSAHNAIIEMVYLFGIFGVIFWFLTFRYVYRYFRRSGGIGVNRGIVLMPFVILIVTSMVSHSFIGLTHLFTVALSFSLVAVFNSQLGKHGAYQ